MLSQERAHRDMHRSRRLIRWLPVVFVLALLVIGALRVLPEIGPGATTGPLLPRPSGHGLSPFIAQGGNVAAACSGVSTCTTGAITNVKAGDALVVVVTEFTTSAGAPSLVEEVTSGGNNALTELGVTPCVSGSGHGVSAIYGLANVAAQTSVTFTANYPAAEYYTIHALDVQGTATSPFEPSGTGICSSAAGTTGTASVTTTQADDLVILGVEIRASTAVAATGGDTLVNDAATTGANLDSGALLDEIDATTGSISLSATFSSASWAAIAVALMAPPLVSGTVSPATAAVDAGQNIGLTTTAATGGTAPITYQWYKATSTSTCSSGTLIGGATGQSYTTPALAVGTNYYCVWATDSSTPTHQVVHSNVATITVNSDLMVTISPSAPSIDHGQTVQLTANPSGGTGPYTYAWYVGATCTGTVLATTPAYTTPALTTTSTYCVAVTDSAHSPVTVDATVMVTVSGSPLGVTITPAAPSIDNGQTVQLTAHPSGGTGADTYAWYAGASCTGTVLATTAAYTTPALTATTTYCVAVTDSAYSPVTASATVTVTVSGSPLGVTITPAAPSIDNGQTVQLTAHPSGGTGADTYAWYAGATCTGSVLATTQSYTTPALTANTTYCVTVTDSAYSPVTVHTTATVTVSASPLGVTITPAAPSIDSGQTVQLTAHPSGGTGADTYAWYPGAGCAGPVLAITQVYTTPALSASTTYCVAVTDSAYSPATVNATATVTVSPSLLVTITPAAPSIDSGQTVQLTANPSGGTAPDTYAWYSGVACTGTVLAMTQVYTTASLTATTPYCVSATDSSNVPASATATATVTVSASPLTVAITPDAPSIDAGQTVQLTANPAGGTGADTYAWYSGSSCSGTVISTTKVYTSPALTSASEYCVAATDSALTPATATATATVAVSASLLTVTITPTAPSTDSGKSVELTALPLGGTPGYSYAWYLGTTCSGAVLATTQVYTSPALTTGTTYCVAVTDNASSPATATANATVKVTPASTSNSGLPPYVYPAVLLAMALLAAFLLLAFLARRGRRVTFIQSGLAPDTEWSLTFAGTAQRSTATRMTFSSRKGRYSYLVQDVAGYTAAPSSGAVEVGNDTPDLRIRFTPLPSESRSSESGGTAQPPEPPSVAAPVPSPASETGSTEPAGSTPSSEVGSSEAPTPSPDSDSGSGKSEGSVQPPELGSEDPPAPAPASEPGSVDSPAPGPEPDSGSEPSKAPAQPAEPEPGIPNSLRSNVKIRFE